MKKQALSMLAAGLLLASPVMAEEVPQTAAPVYNCDFQPTCEVAPGIYGKMGSPVQSKFNMTIGGFVKLDYAYNSVNLGRSGSLAPGSGAIPKTSSYEGQADQSIFTARQSRLWFKVAGPSFLGAKTGALIEADFYGDASAAAESPQFRLRQAWGSLDWSNTQIVFGQAYDIFGPMVMATIDFRQGAAYGTPNNPRVPQIRLTQRINLNSENAIKLVFGVQDPNQNGNNNAGVPTFNPALNAGVFGTAVNVAGQAMWVSKALGVGPGFWGLSMNSLSAGVFGLWGSQKAMLASGNKSVDSWGYGFHTFVPLLKSKDGKSREMTMSFEAQAFMAANMQFNSATAATFVGDVGNPSGAKGYGFGGQFIFYPTQHLGITAGYGRRNAYNYASYQNLPNFQKSSTLIYANVAYDLNAAIRIAAEYENLNTQYGNVISVPTTFGMGGTSGTGTANIGRLALFYFF
ncbi:MAG: hypothetical protein EG824_11785 [Deltaproteobacteria bacterium]|nr:hypothetical protein [Deltaproteobacteria bacterium]